MSSIYIGIGHNDDLVVPQLTDVEILMYSCSESCDHGFDLCIGINLVQPCLLYIQNLSSQRKNCLSSYASGSLCRSSSRVSLYNIDFTLAWILVHAVCQLARQGHTIQLRLPSGQLSGLSGSISGPLRKNGFLHDNLCYCRILRQVNLQLAADNIVYSASGLAVSQLLLCLSFKLRIFNFYADNCS